MTALTLHSPAKLNLFLRILGRRDDGYHELATLMQAIDLCDTLVIEGAEVDAFSFSDPGSVLDPGFPTDQRNLVIKARDLFRRKTGISHPVDLHLSKKIPVGAGLGGGSGNAATTLWGLNRLFSAGISDGQLGEWSSEIGSDIPFFFSSGLAYCTGRGERVMPVSFTVGQRWTLAQPLRAFAATPAVYSALDLSQCCKESPESLLARWEAGERIYVNDLSAPAMKLLPSVQRLKDKLEGEGCGQMHLTGSGSTLFAEHSRGASCCARQPGGWYEPSGIHH